MNVNDDELTFPFSLDFRSQVEVERDVSTDTGRVILTNTWLGNLTSPIDTLRER